MADIQFPAPASDVPLTATLGETVDYKKHQNESPGDTHDIEPLDALAWQGLIKNHPYVAVAAAVAVGFAATMLLRRLWR